VNITIKGGILGLININGGDSISELQPGFGMGALIGPNFGFGPVTISVKVSAANVHEISTEKNAMVIFFFMFIK
jgi:hypothetical protein